MTSSSPSLRTGVVAGIAAMSAALVTMQVATYLLGARDLIESLADGLLLALPVDVFSWLKTTLGEQSKTWLFVGILAGFLALGAGIGAWVRARRSRIGQSATGLFVLGIVLLFAIDREQLTEAFAPTVLSLALGAAVFGTLLWMMLDDPDAMHPNLEGRRRAIVVIASGLGALLFGSKTITLYQRQSETSTESAESATTPAITPNSDFYRISKNFTDPGNDRGPNWFISIDGDVDRGGDWNREQLTALGEQHTITTQLCISNEVGGDLIVTAEWTGVPMTTLLDSVGAAGNYVWFTGVDGYTTSVPMDRCTQPQAWLVWGMNGEPLPEAHGAPVRAVIPGLYGMKSVKWLTGMTVSSQDRQGYWESRGWTNEAVVKSMSRIDFPRRSSNLLPGEIPVRGIAFGGDAGLSGVEISTDGGDTWSAAEITEQPNPDGIAWSLWRYAWQAEAGTHELVVRMIAADGTVQTEDSASPIPDGSSGWHHVDVVVNRR